MDGIRKANDSVKSLWKRRTCSKEGNLEEGKYLSETENGLSLIIGEEDLDRATDLLHCVSLIHQVDLT